MKETHLRALALEEASARFALCDNGRLFCYLANEFDKASTEIPPEEQATFGEQYKNQIIKRYPELF